MITNNTLEDHYRLKDSQDKDFLSHLDDLKDVIIKAFISLLVGFLFSVMFAAPLLDLLLVPYKNFLISQNRFLSVGSTVIKALSPYEALSISIKISLISGIILVSPYLLFLGWNFFSPALLKGERQYFFVGFFLSPFLFLVGVLFCYNVVFPLGLKFLWNYTVYMGIYPDWTITYYINFILGFLVAFGISFELPIALVFLIKMKVLSTATLIEKRKYSIIGIFILAAFLTPADIFSQLLLGIPMIALYEFSIILSKWIK